MSDRTPHEHDASGARGDALGTTILAIETSCDETAAAVVRDGRFTRSSIVASQEDLHAEYGGVVPEIASRAHVERILPVVRAALDEAGIDDPRTLDAVAVGHRPGLIGSLIVGVSAAKALAWAWGRPFIGVDHVVAHLVAAFLDPAEESEPPPVEDAYPALGLVVSGGHSNLFRLRSPLEFDVLGRTIDDAVGGAYDKAASILGLGYPGGPVIDRRAASGAGDERACDLPVSRLGTDSLDFSFSGLKTALLYAVRGTPGGRGGETAFARDASELEEREIDDYCASFQRAAVEALLLKTERALDRLAFEGEVVRSVILGGGVSANSRLRSEMAALAEERGLPLHVPHFRYCLDNAAMIAALAHYRLRAGFVDDFDLSPSPAGSF